MKSPLKLSPLGIVTLLFFATHALSDTHYVSPTGSHQAPYRTWAAAARNIQAAIQAASPGDTVLIAPGAYEVSTPVTIDKRIQVRSANGAATVQISGKNQSRCVSMTAGGAVLEGVTVRSGRADSQGGGIYCRGGTIQSCWVEDCSVTGVVGNLPGWSRAYGEGGGIYAINAQVLNSTVHSNSATFRGGGLYASNSLVQNCNLTTNLAKEYNADSPWFDEGFFVWFATGEGGGAYLANSTLKDCRLSGNSAQHRGGAVFCDVGGRVENCHMSENTATGNDWADAFFGYNTITPIGCGGAVYCRGGMVQDSILISNQSSRDGGGFVCQGGTIQRCWVVSNQSWGISSQSPGWSLSPGETVLTPVPSRGGGGYVLDGGVLRFNVINGNRSVSGGGVFGDTNSLLLQCELTHNQATNAGGGIYMLSGKAVERCRVYENTAREGGGIAAWNTMIGACDLRGNTALQMGGGLYAGDHTGLRSSRFIENSAGEGGGLYGIMGTSWNCLWMGNRATNQGGAVFFQVTGTVYNALLADNQAPVAPTGWQTDFHYCCSTSALPGVSNIVADPGWLNPAQANHRLSANSPCVGRGLHAQELESTRDFYGRTRIIGSSIDIGPAEWSPAINDYDGDGASDLAVFDPLTGNWFIHSLKTGAVLAWASNWGFSGCRPVPGSFLRDNPAAMGVYDPPSGNWYLRTYSAPVQGLAIQWGFAGCIPVPGDYNADGLSDLTIYQQGPGMWISRKTGDGPPLFFGTQWGFAGCQPAPGDYDGDGAYDLSVYYPPAGLWYILNARTPEAPVLCLGLNWGYAGCIPVGGDYDGDGTFDLAVYDMTTGRWYIRSLMPHPAIAFGLQWGGAGMIPVSGDFDGDGTSDLAVYHPPTGTWYIRSLNGKVLAWAHPWGWSGAIPVKL